MVVLSLGTSESLGGRKGSFQTGTPAPAILIQKVWGKVRLGSCSFKIHYFLTNVRVRVRGAGHPHNQKSTDHLNRPSTYKDSQLQIETVFSRMILMPATVKKNWYHTFLHPS